VNALVANARVHGAWVAVVTRDGIKATPGNHLMLTTFAREATVCGTWVSVLAVELIALACLVDAGCDCARVSVRALRVVMATARNRWEDAADVGVTEIAGANVHIEASDCLVLAKLVGAPVFCTGIVVVALQRGQAAAWNGSEEAARCGVAGVAGTGVAVGTGDDLSLTLVGRTPPIGASISVFTVGSDQATLIYRLEDAP